MTQPQRLERGGRIDRDRLLHFTFNGTAYQGHAGDTLASALLANDVVLVGRSWKYHRPRGIVGSGVEEPNAIVQLESGARTVPNARATEIELYDGLSARSVNCWPGVGWDLMAVMGLFAGLVPAGFYYKTFMWPRKLWMSYEHLIRKASGLGAAPAAPDPDSYDKMNVHCDVLVVGAGPSGLSAALAAARTGARVVLADERSEMGGSLLDLPIDDSMPEGGSAGDWVRQTTGELAGMAGVRLLPRSTVFGYHDHNFLTINQRLLSDVPLEQRTGRRERIWRVRARQVVLATGALERPLVFGNNDRPGIMLASAVSSFIHRFGVRPGSRAVVFTNNDGAYRCAMDLAQAGVEIAAVVDPRREPIGPLAARARAAGIPIIAGSVIVDTHGRKRVGAVQVQALDAAGDAVVGAARILRCDLLAVSGGWSPAVHLHAQSGARPHFDAARACFVPGPSKQSERSTGACNGTFAAQDCIAEGRLTGLHAAHAAGFGALPSGTLPMSFRQEVAHPLWRVPSRPGARRRLKEFVDLQNDVTAADILLAAREGYRSIEHVKRYTAMGFGTDQGKLGNVNGMAILAKALGQDIREVGTTTFRPNYTPITFGAIAGRDIGDRFEPVRTTVWHDWHVANGALFEDVGAWKRPWYFPKAGESMREAVDRECLAARTGVAIMDASTLGKIDIQGVDSASFLEWVYTNNWAKLAVGRCRYGLMLDENGMVFDDGVTTRLAEHHYLMTTTTGGAARVLAWLERWLQTEWPHLKVYLTSVTEQFATAAVVGPHSREVMRSVCSDIDFAAESFPFMSYRAGSVAGIPARVMRISFSGELAYEVNVPAKRAQAVWDALMVAGAPLGITPYGTEAMHVLRAEKGFIIVGQDTDGSMTPIDLGMDWIVSTQKDFIGRRSLTRSDTRRASRKQLVGLLTDDPGEVLPEGAQVVADASVARPVPMLGHVTSSYFSAFLGRSIALAVVKGGSQRIGEKVEVPLADGRVIGAAIATPVFIDPAGARQNA